MSKSSLVNEYNKINNRKETKIVIRDVVDVSLMDVLSNNEVEINVKGYKNCLCKESDNLKDYYVECKKCNSTGKFILNGHEVICNECKGEKYLRIHDCYLCNNEGKIVVEVPFKLILKDSYKDNEELIFEFDEYTLILRLNIYDKKDYEVKGNDIYYLKGIRYSKEDYSNKVNKQVKTIKGLKYVKSEFKIKKEIVKLNGCGLNDGNFYFIFDNEVENEKKELYVNVLINENGYVNIKEAINNDCVISKEFVAVNASDYIYVDELTNEYENDEYIIRFNKLNKGDYLIENNKIVYLLKLGKDDLNNDKKSIVINEEKINVNFKKNLKEEEYVNVNKVVLDKSGKKDNLIIKVIPYFDKVYKISIKKNKKVVYVDDYKYSDYRLVESYKSSNYLEDFIRVDDEDRIIVNNDIVYIKRV